MSKEITVKEAVVNLLSGKLFIVVDELQHAHVICSFDKYDQKLDDIGLDSDCEYSEKYGEYIIYQPRFIACNDVPLTKYLPKIEKHTAEDATFYGSLVYLARRANLSSIVSIFDIKKKFKTGRIRNFIFKHDANGPFDYITTKNIIRTCMTNYLTKDPMAAILEKQVCANCKYCMYKVDADFAYTYYCTHWDDREYLIKKVQIKKPCRECCTDFEPIA